MDILTKVTDTADSNTPANDHWYLSMGYTRDNETDERIIDISYSTNGSIDFTRTSIADFNQANTLLQPLLSLLQSRTNSSLNIWKVLNTLFIGYYWFILFDLGETSPTIYSNSSQYLVPLDFSQPISYPNTNNIILNSTLSTLIFSNTILDIRPDKVEEMDDILEAIALFNGASNGDPRIRRIYLCTERQRKQVMNLLVSVFGQGLGLIMAGLTIGLFLLAKFLRVDDTVKDS
jgi:hypothetical protein